MRGSTGEAAQVRLALARHQRRREQGVPTLTVLIGSADEAVRVWQDWVRSMGWAPARIMRADEVDAAELFLTAEATIYLCAAGDGGVQRLAEFVERISRFLDAHGIEQASAVLALAVGRADAEAYLRDERYSRARALFAEGMVDVPVALAAMPDAASERTAALLTRSGVQPETVESFKVASAARQQVVSREAGDEADDRARSAAERFLFDLLGDLPETAGLFELNVRLAFCFGPMSAEVDLLADSLRLAVEIDGFHHFQDPECYRRDRRKDALLQRQGYLVLRFLAEDVVVRLEDILEEIRAAVAFRRATHG